jgi:hypothetical protein
MRNPLWWPTRLFTRVGPWQSWIVAVLIIFGLRAAGLETAALIAGGIWVLLCVWSWIVPPILSRVQGLDR